MAWWMAAGAVVGGLSSYFGGQAQQNAANMAGRTQIDMANQSTGVTVDMFNRAMQMHEPYRQAGLHALSGLSEYTGLDYNVDYAPFQPMARPPLIEYPEEKPGPMDSYMPQSLANWRDDPTRALANSLDPAGNLSSGLEKPSSSGSNTDPYRKQSSLSQVYNPNPNDNGQPPPGSKLMPGKRTKTGQPVYQTPDGRYWSP